MQTNLVYGEIWFALNSFVFDEICLVVLLLDKYVFDGPSESLKFACSWTSGFS